MRCLRIFQKGLQKYAVNSESPKPNSLFFIVMASARRSFHTSRCTFAVILSGSLFFCTSYLIRDYFKK